MRNTNYILFGALGVAAILLLTTGKGKKLRRDISDTAKQKTKKWAGKWSNINKNSADKLASLRDLLSSEVEGLSNDARARIERIVHGTTTKIRKNMNNHIPS